MKQRILEAGVFYLSSQVLIFIMSLIKGLILPKLLTPGDYGLLAIILLIISYSKIANLGILNTFDREYPKMLANENYFHDKESYKNTCFSLFMINNMTYSIGVIIFSYWKYCNNMLYFLILTLIAIGMLFDNINEFVVDIHRGHKNFRLVSINRIAVNIVGILSLVAATYFWGIYGALVSIFVANVITIYFYIKIKDKPYLSLNVSLIKSIYTSGFYLFVVLMFSILMITIDRVVVAKFYELKDVGLYNLSRSMAGIVLLAFTSATYVIYPFMLSHYAQNPNTQSLQKYYEKLGLIYTWVTPLILSAVYFFFTAFIPWYLPAYKESLPFMHLLVIGTCWIALSQVNDTFLLTINQQSRIVRNQVSVLCFSFLCFGYIIAKSLSTYYIALSFAIYPFCYAIMSFFSIASCLKINLKFKLILLTKFIFPFVFFLVLSSALFVANKSSLELSNNNMGTFVFDIVAILICGIPFIWYINKKTAFISEIYLVVKLKMVGKTAC